MASHRERRQRRGRHVLKCLTIVIRPVKQQLCCLPTTVLLRSLDTQEEAYKGRMMCSVSYTSSTHLLVHSFYQLHSSSLIDPYPYHTTLHTLSLDTTSTTINQTRQRCFLSFLCCPLLSGSWLLLHLYRCPPLSLRGMRGDPPTLESAVRQTVGI